MLSHRCLTAWEPVVFIASFLGPTRSVAIVICFEKSPKRVNPSSPVMPEKLLLQVVPSPRHFRFGPFELDSRTGELHKHGIRIRLKQQACQILLMLLNHPGEVVLREEIRQKLWPQDTVVEFDHSINAAIQTLRDALGESAGRPRYIETLPRRGYRFIGIVETALPERIGEPPLLSALETAKPAPVAVAPPGSRTRLQRLGVVFALVAAVGIAFQYVWNRSLKNAAIPQWEHVEISRLTATGQVQGAAISPDGRVVVYANESADKAALRVRNLSTGADYEIGGVGMLKTDGLAISPTGQEVYFVEGPDWSPGNLYRIPIQGGVPALVASGANSPPSFSPAGNQFVFHRADDQHGQAQIVVAGTAGGERIIAGSQYPLYAGKPQWSPRGDSIAFAATPAKFFHWKLMAQPARRDAPAWEITPKEWYRIGSLAWIAGGRAILVEAEDTPNAEHQIWKVGYPDGRLQRLTADPNSYHGLSVSADSQILVSVRRESISQMLLVRPDHRPFEEGVQQIMNPGPGRDGWDGLAFTNDGRLVFSSAVSGNGELWTMDLDGSHKQQLTRTDARNFRPSLSRDGRVLVCSSTRGGGHDIWRMNPDGTDSRQLTTSGADSLATISPDGKWIAYMSMASGRRLLQKMDVDGTHQIELSETPMVPEAPAISPDSRSVAFLTYAPSEQSFQIQMIRVDDRKPIACVNVPGFSTIRWTAAGDAVTYIRTENGVDNIWAQPVAGGCARQITRFREGRIHRFAWSWSGKQLALAHVNTASDAVVLRPAH